MALSFRLGLLGLLCLTSGSFAAELVLKNVHVVDPVSRTIAVRSISIQDGKIESVTVETLSSRGNTLDLSGKWLIPGLHDMHVHSFGNFGPKQTYEGIGIPLSAKRMEYAGVTSYLDLFYGPEDDIFRLRDAQRRDVGTGEATGFAVPGADIYAAGPIFTCTGGHGTEYGVPTRVVNTPAEAEREVTALAAKHPDVVKLVYDHARMRPSMDQPTMAAVIATASKLGLKTVVHIGTWQDAKEATLAGATVITHLYEKPLPDDIVRLMHDRGTYSVPTMTVQMDLWQIHQDPTILDRPLLKAVASKDFLDLYRDTVHWDQATSSWLDWQRPAEGEYRRSLKKLIDGGVRIMAGTDAGNLGTFQGFSLHRELELMVKAGMSTWDALYAATIRPGQFLDQHVGFQPGDRADFVVLNASPIDDIRNTEDIAQVIHRGKLVERAAASR